MYETINSLARGGVFWGTVVKQWPLPYSLGDLDGAVLTLDGGSDFMLIVVQSERVGETDCVLVQLKHHGGRETCLAVTITRHGDYIAGAHNDSPVDEVGAVAALALYQSDIRGQWHRVFE